MHTNEGKQIRAPEPGALTTEDLARPETGGEAEERKAAVYPGEATSVGPDEADGNDRADGPAGTEGTAPAGTEGTAEAEAGDAAEGTAAQEADGPGTADEPLLSPADADAYRTSWSEIQGRFVDDPKEAVESADNLVAEVMRTLASSFSTHKQELEGQWDRGEQVPTEDLRLALQRYRSFFNRLLKT